MPRRTIAKIFQMPWILNLIPFIRREPKGGHGVCDVELWRELQFGEELEWGTGQRQGSQQKGSGSVEALR